MTSVIVTSVIVTSVIVTSVIVTSVIVTSFILTSVIGVFFQGLFVCLCQQISIDKRHRKSYSSYVVLRQLPCFFHCPQVSKLDSEKMHFKEELEACKQGINEMAKGQVAILI